MAIPVAHCVVAAPCAVELPAIMNGGAARRRTETATKCSASIQCTRSWSSPPPSQRASRCFEWGCRAIAGPLTFPVSSPEHAKSQSMEGLISGRARSFSRQPIPTAPPSAWSISPTSSDGAIAELARERFFLPAPKANCPCARLSAESAASTKEICRISSARHDRRSPSLPDAR